MPRLRWLAVPPPSSQLTNSCPHCSSCWCDRSPDPDPDPHLNPSPNSKPTPTPNQVRAQLRRPHALLSLMEAHVARGAHNTLSQYWVVSLLMALRAIESDCFGSPCTSHNVSGTLHGPQTLARAYP